MLETPDQKAIEQVKPGGMTRGTLFQVVTSGDTSAMTPDQKLQYYRAMCDAAGIDYRLTPFQFIKTRQGERLYATKAATNQLSLIHKCSIEITKQEVVNGTLVIYVRVSTPDSRFTDEMGAVALPEGTKGEEYANILMKCSTKGKRRGVLAHCGLGVLDETETDTMGGGQVVPIPVVDNAAPPALPAKPVEAETQAVPAAQPAQESTRRRGKSAKPEAAPKQTEQAAAVEILKPPAPAPEPPAPAPAPAPAQTAKPKGRSERMKDCCTKAGTSAQNGVNFLEKFFGRDLTELKPIEVESFIEALEAYTEKEEKRNSQALINDELPSWDQEPAEARKRMDAAFSQLYTEKYAAIKQRISPK